MQKNKIEKNENVNKTFKIISECIDTIYTEEDAWEAKDYTAKERVEFIEQLNSTYQQPEKDDAERLNFFLS